MAVVEALDVLEELMSNIMDVDRHAIKKLGFYAAGRRLTRLTETIHVKRVIAQSRAETAWSSACGESQ